MTITQFVIVFDERARSGSNIVGPFADRAEADAWAMADSVGSSEITSWIVSPLETP